MTALSPNGTLDAFLVLWRNVNLVASLARLYYGRPGLPGTWLILRDVSLAILLSSVLEQISDMGGRACCGKSEREDGPFPSWALWWGPFSTEPSMG